MYYLIKPSSCRQSKELFATLQSPAIPYSNKTALFPYIPSLGVTADIPCGRHTLINFNFTKSSRPSLFYPSVAWAVRSIVSDFRILIVALSYVVRMAIVEIYAWTLVINSN